MEYFTHILALIGIYTILAISLDLIIGYTGIPSLGHASFALVGAYTTTLITIHFGVNSFLGLFFGGIFASFLGAIVAYPSFRLKDDYLSLATLGLAIVIYSITNNWISLTRGPMGISAIPSFTFMGYELTNTWQNAIVIWIFALICYLIISTIVNNPFGRVLKGIREDEVAILSLGKNVKIFKFKVFLVGSFFAGLAGALYAHYISFISPADFNVMESISILLIVILGGMGTLKGSVIGAFVLVGLPEVLRFFNLSSTEAATLRQMLYGLTLSLIVIYRPQGLIGKYYWK